jgi:putative transposase
MSTHQQLLYHIVFSTKNRKQWLTEQSRPKVFAYMAGVCKELGGFALIVNGYVDHAHLLVRIPGKIAVSEFVGKLKSSTSKHINDTSGLILKFGWQDGFGAFTVSVSAKDKVYQYIKNQVQHHQSQSFEKEYLGLLDKHEVEYDLKYVFD